MKLVEEGNEQMDVLEGHLKKFRSSGLPGYSRTMEMLGPEFSSNWCYLRLRGSSMGISEREANRDAHWSRLAEYWRVGQPFQTGRLLFEDLIVGDRPEWAGAILKLVLSRSGIQASRLGEMRPKWAASLMQLVLVNLGVRSVLIERVLYIADHPSEWRQGHCVFGHLRRSLLWLEWIGESFGFTDKQLLLCEILGLAELVAKVSYNATDPPDPFDDDSGWRIAAKLRGFVDRWDDEDFSKAAWAALCYRNG